jgi:putative acetyltransferase
MPLTVGPETPRQAEVLNLLQQSDAYSASLYPMEGRRPLSPAALSAPGVHFLVARLGGAAVGCCALIEQGDGTGELKRMIVAESARQQGVGRALMAAVEAAAIRRGLHLIQMEVGARSTGAQVLYRQTGYRDRGPFGTHRLSPHSIFLEKRVGTETD